MGERAVALEEAQEDAERERGEQERDPEPRGIRDEQADAAARASGPAEDAAELPAGDAAADWFDTSATTSIEVYSDFAPALGEAFGDADEARPAAVPIAGDDEV